MAVPSTILLALAARKVYSCDAMTALYELTECGPERSGGQYQNIHYRESMLAYASLNKWERSQRQIRLKFIWVFKVGRQRTKSEFKKMFQKKKYHAPALPPLALCFMCGPQCISPFQLLGRNKRPLSQITLSTYPPVYIRWLVSYLYTRTPFTVEWWGGGSWILLSGLFSWWRKASLL